MHRFISTVQKVAYIYCFWIKKLYSDKNLSIFEIIYVLYSYIFPDIISCIVNKKTSFMYNIVKAYNSKYRKKKL